MPSFGLEKSLRRCAYETAPTNTLSSELRASRHQRL